MSSGEITVRAAEPRDAEAYTRILNQRSVASGTLQIIHMSQKERDEWIRWTPHDRPLVAELDGGVVGMAGLHIYRGRRAHVGWLGMNVDEGFQNRGVGSALLRAILDLADNWYNLYRLELEVWTDNAAAIHLYEKFGFVVEGTHRAYGFRDGAYIDALSMARLHPGPAREST